MIQHAKAPNATKHPVALGGLALLALACLQLAVFAASSQAAVEATRTYVPGAFFGSQGSDPGQFNTPRQIAAEPGTGNLLVTDSGNGRVQVLSVDSKGNPSFLTTLGSGTLVTPVGIAVDQGPGAIYVSDSGAGKVFRFTSDGAPTPTYTLDPTFASPTLSSYASQLAVDPSTHDLLVADTGAQVIRRFDVADGTELNSFNGSTSSGGQFTSLRGLAVGPTGLIYVVDEVYPESIYFEGASRIEQFEGDGSPLGQLQGIKIPGAVGVDPLGGTVISAEAHAFYLPPREVALYKDSDSPSTRVGIPVAGGPVGVAVSDLAGSGFALLTETELGGLAGAPGIQPFQPAEIPAAEAGPTDSITATSAHVTGSVAPGTLSGEGVARFEYSLDGKTWESSADQTGITGPGASPVSADLTGLRPNSTYSLRVKIANDDFNSVSEIATFSTDVVGPGVELGAVSDRSSSSATLHGTVNPFGQQTTYHFEYGSSDSYGSVAPVGREDVAGRGYAPRSVAAGVSGLAPSATYHYRLVATNATGTKATPDRIFTTRPAGEPARGYEQVTPVDKGGAAVNTLAYYQARTDGEGIIFQTKNTMNLPGVESAPNQSRYAARRTAAGWDLRQLDPPQKEVTAPELAAVSTIAVSSDLSHALVRSNLAIAPGGADGTGNLYRRDIETGALEFVAKGISNFQLAGPAGSDYFYGGSADFSTIFLISQTPLTNDPGSGYDIYEWSTTGGLRLASPPGGSPSGFSRLNWPARTLVSRAGIGYFAVGSGPAEGIYSAHDGITEQILDPGGFPSLIDITPDGRYLNYIDQLTGEVHRYDTRTAESEPIFTTNLIQGAIGYMGMSEDGSTILDSGTTGSALTVWHDGVLSPVAAAEGGEAIALFGAMVSPNGRYVAFSSALLSGQSYDNSGCAYDPIYTFVGGDRCKEVYLYDVVGKKLSCASCPADGAPSAGHAHLAPSQLSLSLYGPRRVSDSGGVLFDTPTKLVAADTNGMRDVYIYEDGEARLISPGKTPHNAFAVEATPNFSDIYFVTDESLVGQDTDNQFDLYDARLGGGIASQSGSAAPPVCVDPDCRAPSPPAPSPANAASESVTGKAGYGKQAKPRHPHKNKKRGHKKKHKTRHSGRRKDMASVRSGASPATHPDPRRRENR